MSIKISEDTEDLKNIINQYDLNYIYRTLSSRTTKETFSKLFKSHQEIHSMLSDTEIKLEINNKRNLESTQMFRT